MKKKTKIYPEIVKHKAERFAHELVGGVVKHESGLTLALWASRYMEQEVIGVQAPNTAAAKKRDLTAFLAWYHETNGHLEISDWMPRDTQGFLDHLGREGRAATSINRSFATLRHFARWTHDRENTPFSAGLPTRGIKELTTDEPEAQKLGQREIHRLFKAADKLVATDTRKNAQPHRNRAILALLYYSGLRVSEMCALKRDQYNGTHLVNVRRKGRARTRRLYLSKECRRYLDDYLDTQNHSPWLFPSAKFDKPLTRVTVWRILVKLADEATKHAKADLKIYPHRLRHTFGFEVRKRTGSDTETAALLGHSGLKYVGRYVRRTEKERRAILDDL